METLEKIDMIATISNIKGTELSPDLLRRNNINPEQIITIVIKTEIGVAEEQQKTQSKWADVLKDFRKKPFTKEASETMQKASQSFREGFAFRDAPDFTNAEK